MKYNSRLAISSVLIAQFLVALIVADLNLSFSLHPQILPFTMSTMTELTGSWHPGEVAVHKLLSIPNRGGKPTSRGMPPQYGYRIAASPLVAFGTLDDEGRPWTTIWGGERGFSRPIQQGFLGIKSLVDKRHDPVVQALLGSATPDGELVRTERPLSALSVDLENRDRVKLAGRFVAGALSSKDGTDGAVGEIEGAMLVLETLGNCPKYMNKKVIRAHLPSPELVSEALPLPPAALSLIDKADMFFLTTANGDALDTNHRGGPAAFIRVAHNSADEVVVVYPEYSGNRLYESLGNLYLNPRIGIAVPDFDTSDVLYLTGTATVLAGPEAAALIPHTKLAVRITVTAARFVKDSLPFRGVLGERSPYNPPVRRLASEGALLADGKGREEAAATATLIKRTVVTPTINRYTFRLDAVRHKPRMKRWEAGQYVTLDLGPELDEGWSHMRDTEPLSLNDDFVRTFTVSSPPPGGRDEAEIEDGTEIEITVRTNGPVTWLLARHNLRMPLEIPVVGFGGEEGFRMTALGGRKVPVFVAGGVGITPLLAQVGDLLREGANVKLEVVWTLRAEDLPLAVEVLERNRSLGEVLRLFVTGLIADKEKELVSKAEGFGATVFARRITKGDVLGTTDDELEGRKFYLCAGPELQKTLVEWLNGEEVVSESFNY